MEGEELRAWSQVLFVNNCHHDMAVKYLVSIEIILETTTQLSEKANWNYRRADKKLLSIFIGRSCPPLTRKFVFRSMVST